MTDRTYNGWANYATWRVNLEIFDGMSPRDVTGRSLSTPGEIKDALRDYAEEVIESSSQPGLARDYAMAFLSDVDWWQIADNIIGAYADEETEEADA